MKRGVAVGMLFCLGLSLSASAIGLQHGLFRSQSTQGTQWMGTAQIVSEHYDITVYPDYLDVELDWVFEVGGTEPDSFANALEIVGNLNLEDNSSVVSMLVWYKDKILKAKLKENKTARDQYETVVARDADAPPPPRDPVLLEMIRDDNYDISIFPVEFGGQRKVRIRYLIPGQTDNGEMLIGYPHAFTDKASVSIKKGPGVEAYRLVTSDVIEPVFYNDEFEQLPASRFCFTASYGNSSSVSRITSIIPVLSEKPNGSCMYLGNFTTYTFAGTMAHISTPTAGDIILKTSAKEDYVVIWRWNSTDILRHYTQQIINQATTLKSFFTALNASSKRGALIISNVGGESKTFTLDNRGGDTFSAMLAYLTELANLDVPSAGTLTSVTISTEEAQAFAQQSFKEFKAALQKAVDLVKESDAKKYILILTAGAVRSTAYDTNIDTAGTKDITISLFSRFYTADNRGYDYPVWPGVALQRMVAPVEQSSLKIFAYISNGLQVDSFQTNAYSYYGSASANDRFIYSNKPLQEELTWKMFNNNELVLEFKEPLTVLPVDDPHTYASLVGSLKSMMPLTETMPSSLASTLGFIDMKYTLLALEDDALDPTVAEKYRKSGVPLLTEADIFPSPDEKAAIPVADWLKANPRETSGSDDWVKRGGIVLVDMVEDAVFSPTSTNAKQWANPQAEVITIESFNQEVAKVYDIAPVVLPEQHITTDHHRVRLQQRHLVIDFGSAVPYGAELVLYDMKGRVVMRWKLDRALTAGMMNARLPLLGIPSGFYLVRLEKSTVSFAQSIMIR